MDTFSWLSTPAVCPMVPGLGLFALVRALGVLTPNPDGNLLEVWCFPRVAEFLACPGFLGGHA